MKVYLTPPQPDRGLERIATALRRYAPPSVTIHTFPNISNNDLTVIYAIGRRDSVERQCEKVLRAGKRYAIIQICLRSTMAPNACDWQWIWSNATVVWSYYDLLKALYDDGEGLDFSSCMNFYHAPLGADASVFYDRQSKLRNLLIITSGSSRLSESVREAHLAAESLGGLSMHLGPDMRLSQWAFCKQGISDGALAQYYSCAQFVSGLRRKEGFEMPAVEGLLCGARPIVFDSLDYRWNYGDHAEYIQETDRQGVVDQLVELFKRGARGVTEEERADAVERFNWETIVRGFYERLR